MQLSVQAMDTIDNKAGFMMMIMICPELLAAAGNPNLNPFQADQRETYGAICGDETPRLALSVI